MVRAYQIQQFIKQVKQPFIIGGDFNMTMDDMKATGWPEMMNAVMVGVEGDTCNSGGGSNVSY